MKKLMITLCAAIAAVNVLAEKTVSQQAAQTSVSQPSAKEIAKQPTVEKLLLEEDGVTLVTAPDGSFQFFVRGTADYMFVNPKVERNTRRVAKLNAQKHFAEFIKNKVVGTEGVGELQKQSLTLSGDGKIQEQQSSAESLEVVKATVSANTEAVINGLVTVESRKVPVPGTTSGSIQITMVYSSKTAKASLALGKKLQDHQAELQINEAKNEARVNAARLAAQNSANGAVAQGAAASTVNTTPAANNATQAPGAYVPANKAERRVNKTEY